MRYVETSRVVVALALAGTVLAGCGKDRAEPAAKGAEAPAAAPAAAPAQPARSLPQGVTQKMVDQGRELYATNCAYCHDTDGNGTQLGPSLRDSTWVDVSGQMPEIVEVIRNGVPQPKVSPIPMPPKGGMDFDEEQVRALAAYVYSLAPK